MNKLASKKVFYSIFSLAAISLPLLLTSCADTTYYSVPIQLGAESHSDTNSLWNTVFTNNDPWTDLTGNTTGLNEKNMNEYIPSHYLVDNSKSIAMGYCQPQRIENDVVTGDSNLGWNTPALTAFDKNNTKILSYRNSNLSTAIDFSTYIAQTLSTYYNVLLNYIGQPGIATNSNNNIRDEWLNALFGATPDSSTLGFEMTTPEQKAAFYNFIFSNANMLAASSPIEFGVDRVNFHYESSYFGPGPLLSASPTNTFTDDIGSDITLASGKEIPLIDLLLSNWQIDDALKNGSYYNDLQHPHHVYVYDNTNELIANSATASGNKHVVGGNVTSGDGAQSYTSPYVTYITDDNTKEIKNVSFNPVPILISADNTEFSYYKFKKYLSFNPNDWLLDTTDIQNTVNKSYSWRNYDKFVGKKPEIKQNTITIKHNSDVDLPTPADGESILPTYPDNCQFKDPKDSDQTHYYHMDPATLDLGKMINNSNQYIAFVQYGCSVRNDKDTGDTYLYPYTYSWPSIYPLWLFQNDFTKDTLDNNFDQSLLEFFDNSKFFTDHVDEKYGQKYEYACDFDTAKLADKFNKYFYDFFQHYIASSDLPYPATLNAKQKRERQYSLWFAENMFGKKTAKTNPSDFIS